MFCLFIPYSLPYSRHSNIISIVLLFLAGTLTLAHSSLFGVIALFNTIIFHIRIIWVFEWLIWFECFFQNWSWILIAIVTLVSKIFKKWSGCEWSPHLLYTAAQVCALCTIANFSYPFLHCDIALTLRKVSLLVRNHVVTA